MLLIIEIILTIFVWRKGWRWWAIVPVGLALLIGLSIGFGIGISGGDTSTIGMSSILIDLAAICALVIMLAVGPKKKEDTIDTSDKNL